MSEPTWPNHPQLFTLAGFRIRTYPYTDPSGRRIDEDALLAALGEASPGDIVLLHGSCHNPTGVDPSPALWRAIGDLLEERRLLPLVDFAYQGFGDGHPRGRRLDGGADPARRRAPHLDLVLQELRPLQRARRRAARSSPRSGKDAAAAQSNVKIAIRSNYSNPPSHGADIVTTILGDPELRAQWEVELAGMRARIKDNRARLVEALASRGIPGDWAPIADAARDVRPPRPHRGAGGAPPRGARGLRRREGPHQRGRLHLGDLRPVRRRARGGRSAAAGVIGPACRGEGIAAADGAAGIARRGHGPRTIARMPIEPVALFRAVGLTPDGPARWGAPIRAAGPGVFVVEWPASADRAPVDISAVGTWLARVPTLLVDGERPTGKGLAARLAAWWLPGETIVYVGSAKALAKRLDALVRTPLGDARPNPAGQWLKALRGFEGARVWWAATDAAEEYEDALLEAFAAAVPAAIDGRAARRVARPAVREPAPAGRRDPRRRRHGLHGRAGRTRRAEPGRRRRRAPAGARRNTPRTTSPASTTCSSASPAASRACRSRRPRRTRRARSGGCSGRIHRGRPARWASSSGPGRSRGLARTSTGAGRSAACGAAAEEPISRESRTPGRRTSAPGFGRSSRD